MTNDVENFLAHYGVDVEPALQQEDVEDFLAHFGVIGMKWGKRKAAYQSLGSTRQTRQRAAAQNYLDQNHGSKAAAISKTVGKSLGIAVLANVGTFAVSGLTGNAGVRAGAGVVGALLGISNVVSGVRDVVSIAKSDSHKS